MRFQSHMLKPTQTRAHLCRAKAGDCKDDDAAVKEESNGDFNNCPELAEQRLCQHSQIGPLARRLCPVACNSCPVTCSNCVASTSPCPAVPACAHPTHMHVCRQQMCTYTDTCMREHPHAGTHAWDVHPFACTCTHAHRLLPV